MGCATSKVEDLPAVALCRERCHHIEQAIVQRYALAESHLAYIHSLKEIGFSLHRFFDQQDLDNAPSSSSSPFLNLPPHKKGDSLPSASPAPAPAPVLPPSSSSPPHHHSHSHSHSGSHIQFHSDSDDDEDDSDDDDDDGDSGSLHHSANSTPLDYQTYLHQDETLNSMTGGFMNMNFMQNRSTQSVVHEQQPISSETLHVGAGSSSYSSYNNNYPSNYYENPSNPNPYPYYTNPPPYTSNYGYYESQPPYGSAYPPPQGAVGASSSKPPPPPPSPPRTSPWEFLNPFDTFDKFYPQNSSSRDSRSVREEEGIPDLEDESYQDEVVKQVHGHQKFSDGGANYKNKGIGEEGMGNGGEAPYEAPRRSDQKEEVKFQVPLVDKNVVAANEERRSEEKINVPTYKVKLGSLPVSVIIREIKSQFDRASESGNEISMILEVGRVPFHRKNAVYQVSSKMLHSITPSLSVVSSHPSSSKGTETSTTVGSVYSDMEENVGLRSGNLLSTLQKLYIWEKKLYDEVKAEEKMRVIHERKLRRLKRLDERGAEAQKIDSTRTLVRTLSTKIRIAIQVVDKISVKINKLRDEELWPQMNELIKGLIRMWKVMLECHRTQCQAIAEAKNLDAIASNRKFNGDHIEATIQLERVLLNWISSFSCWVSAQKGYVKALNSWLLKCLLYEPEDTEDGRVPFSPGRMGAPPVFVICNQWSHAMDKISEKEVIDAMRNFTMSVHQLSERHSLEIRQRMLVNKDIDRKVKLLEREEQKIQKEWQIVDKKMTLLSGQGIGLPIHEEIVHQSNSPNSSLHLGLKQIFESMERFTASSMQVYEELQIRCEEDRLVHESDKVS